MIYLITGASHTGKTYFSQKLVEKFSYPCLSIDHLKMGLIRSKNTALTPLSPDQELTQYLWPIVREMIKTALENEQNLIVEGVYIPFTWREDFSSEELKNIRFCCLVFSENYIKNHFDQILSFASVIEKRISDDITIDTVLEDNAFFLEGCKKQGLSCYLIDGEYHLPEIKK